MNKVNLCVYCGQHFFTAEGKQLKLTIDHFIPTSKGGKRKGDNTLRACLQCNRMKSDYLPHEFIAVLQKMIDKCLMRGVPVFNLLAIQANTVKLISHFGDTKELYNKNTSPTLKEIANRVREQTMAANILRRKMQPVKEVTIHDDKNPEIDICRFLLEPEPDFHYV